MKYIHICDMYFAVIWSKIKLSYMFVYLLFFQLSVDINLNNNAPQNLDIRKHDVGVSIKPIGYSYRIFFKNKIISISMPSRKLCSIAMRQASSFIEQTLHSTMAQY